MKKNKLFLFSLLLAASQSLCGQNINVNTPGETIKPLWNEGTCAGRVHEGLRTSWVEQLQLVKEQCGFKYLRMHGLFEDDLNVYKENAKGEPIYNWQYLDEVYDRMLATGVRPFVELSFFPKAIAAENSLQQMWYKNNISFDAKKLPKWKALVQAFTQHMVDRYGLSEVQQWYFEVWNEPNLNMYPKAGFFHGTKSDYFKLYKASAEAVKAVSSSLRVGGPATSNFIADTRFDGEVYDQAKSRFYNQEMINKQQWKGAWIEDFIKYCERENLPVDFITTHAYPTDYALDPESGKSKDAVRYVNSLHDDLSWLKKTLAASKYPKAEVHITEWSTSPNSRDVMHDLLPPAAYIVKCNLDNLGMANSVMYWTFTDIFEEKGGGDKAFHGGFGMISFQGIVKPSYHAYRMLNQLGDEKLYYADPLFVSKCSQTGKISAIAFNYPKEFEQKVPSAADKNTFMNASAKQVDFTLDNLSPNAQFLIETLDKNHGYAYDVYQQMGAPSSPTPAQTKYLKEVAEGTKKEVVEASADGKLRVKLDLQPWTVVLIKQM